MYLPENDSQMFDILTELRVYARLHDLPNLAEKLDDAIALLALETRRNTLKAAAALAEDRR